MRKKTKLLLFILSFFVVILGSLLYYQLVYYPSFGSLGVITNPIGATVYINDEKVGESPVKIRKKVGTYSLRATKDGYDDYVQNVEIKSGGSEIVGALLTKKVIE